MKFFIEKATNKTKVIKINHIKQFYEIVIINYMNLQINFTFIYFIILNVTIFTFK